MMDVEIDIGTVMGTEIRMDMGTDGETHDRRSLYL